MRTSGIKAISGLDLSDLTPNSMHHPIPSRAPAPRVQIQSEG